MGATWEKEEGRREEQRVLLGDAGAVVRSLEEHHRHHRLRETRDIQEISLYCIVLYAITINNLYMYYES